MVLVLTATLFLPYGVSSSFAHLFNFQWTANHANDEVDFYRIYWSYVSREYDDPSAPDVRMKPVPGGGLVYPATVDNIAYDIPEVSPDDIVCFVVTAIDDEGYESDYSNQLCYGPMIDDFIITENNYTSFDLSGWAEAGAAVNIYLSGAATPMGSATADQYGAWTASGLDFTGIPEGEVELVADSNGKRSPIAVGILDTATSSFTAGPGATDVTNTSATIMWSTNDATKSVLEYRTADQSLPEEEQQQGQLQNNDFLIDHSMVINGLTPATSYYYRVRATDVAGNVLLSSEKAFKTSFEPDTTDPQLTLPVHNVESATSVNISWNVNELCNTVLRYGTVSGALSASVLDFGTGNRTVILTNLTGNTIYYYQVEATDNSGNGPVISLEQDFTTLIMPDNTPPVIDEATIDVEVEDRRATITWVTDEFSDSVVRYGLTPAYGQFVAVATDVKNHIVVLTALNSETPYYFRVESTDDDGIGPTVSSGKTFTTLATPDTTDPEFDSPPTVNVTDTTATITWRTNEACSSSVQYDTVSRSWDDYANIKDEIILKTQHSVTLTGLMPDTPYFYQVGIFDAAGNGPTISLQSGFLTESTPDTTEPQFVVPPTVTSKTDTTAVIAWSTDEDSSSLVRYGTSSSNWDGYPFSLNSATLAQGHEITLTNLTPDTDYFVMAGSTDALGNGPALSQEVGFSTDVEVDDERPRVTVPPTVTGITNTSVTIQWQTDEPANGEVRFDTIEMAWEDYAHVVIDSNPDTTHTVVLNNLDPEIRYYFRVGSTDAAGNGPSTDPAETNNPFSEEMFTTLADPDNEAPQIIKGPEVAAMDIDSAIITWETDEPSNSLVQYGLSGATWSDLTSSTSDGTMTTKHSVTLTDLAPSTRYHFAVGSQDAAGNGPLVNPNATNPSVVSSFTTEAEADTVAPVISNVFMSFATDTTALITWITDEPANSLVQYGTEMMISSEWGSYPYAESDADMQNEHSVTITNLQPGTHYVFRIASTDANGNGPTYNPSPSNNPYIEGSFTTNVFPDTEAPQIAGDVSIVVNVAAMSAVVTWTTPDEPGNSQVQYDVISQGWGGYAFSENDAEMVRAHSVTLTNLRVDTIYYVRVSSVDASGNNHAASNTDLNPSLEYNFILESPPPSPDAPDLPGSPNTPAEQASGEDVATCFIQSSGAGRLLNFEF